MNRTETIRKLLALGPLEMEHLLIIMGGDRAQTRADIRLMLQRHEVYLSNRHYQLNRPERRAVRQPSQRYIPTATRAQPFMLQAVW